MRPTIPTTLLLLGASMVLAPLSPADDAPGSATGRLEATGSGRVVAEGSMVVYGLVNAPATVAVAPRTGRRPDVRVVVTIGRRTVVRTGRRVSVPRGRARILVDATDADVRVTGRRMALSIAGSADLRLRGSGTFILDGLPPQPWFAARVVTLGDGPEWRTRAERDDDSGERDGIRRG